MTLGTESCDICGSICFIFFQQLCRMSVQCSHQFLSKSKSSNHLFFGRQRFYLTPFLWLGLKPLHSIYCELCSQKFSHDENISNLRIVWHHKFTLRNCCDGNTTNHWPRIINGLSTCDLGSSLQSTVVESLDHQRSDYLSFSLVHF